MIKNTYTENLSTRVSSYNRQVAVPKEKRVAMPRAFHFTSLSSNQIIRKISPTNPY